MQTIAELLAQELGASPVHVQNVIDLLDQGNTIPFIARYRKELHGLSLIHISEPTRRS